MRQRVGPMTTVTIYRPSKTAMQSGRSNTKMWVLEFDTGPTRFVEPLMGWVGSDDTTRQVRLRFSTKEEAVAYAEHNGFQYRVQEPKTRRIKPKSYAENFAFNRVE